MVNISLDLKNDKKQSIVFGQVVLGSFNDTNIFLATGTELKKNPKGFLLVDSIFFLLLN